MQPVPTLSDTRDWIAFYRRGKEDNAKSDIWLINVQTKQEIQITNTGHYYEESPVWLSNEKIVYTIEPQLESYSERDLVVVDFSTGKQKLLDYWTWQNCPSSDRTGVDEKGNIYYIPVGLNETMMLSWQDVMPFTKTVFSEDMAKRYGLKYLMTPFVSQDGTEFLFSACDTQKYRIMHKEQKKPYFDIYYYNFRDTTFNRITYGGYDNGYASWIGRDSIIFSSNRDGNWELYLMNQDGRILKRLTYTDSIDEWQGATVSPDHSQICYAGYDLKTKDLDIWIMELKTGEIRHLTKGGKPAWSPAR